MKKMYLDKSRLALKRVSRNAEGSIVVPEGVISIEKRAFVGCGYITEVSLPSSLIELREKAFEGCHSLTSITIPEGVIKISKRAFAECSDLKTVVLPSSLKVIDKGAFEDCSSLIHIELPEGLEIIGESAFSGCDELEAVSIPSSVTVLGKEAFSYCKRLDTIIIPEGIEHVPARCFYRSGLSHVSFPDSLTTIGDEAFEYCMMESIDISQGVTSIGKDAFRLAGAGAAHLRIGASTQTIGVCAFWENSFQSIEVDPANPFLTDAGCNVIMENESGRIIFGAACSTIPNTAKAIGNGAFHSAPKVLDIPGNVEIIETSAFNHIQGSTFILREGVKTIQWSAFHELQKGNNTVYIPASVETIEGQNTSVEFHLDAGNKDYIYDAAGKNIISENGELVWGHIGQGIPTDGVSKISALFNINLGSDDLIVPDNVRIVDENTLRRSYGIKRVVMTKGTKTNASDSAAFCCDIKLLVPLSESSSGITKSIEYIIPKGTPRSDIDDTLGDVSIFKWFSFSQLFKKA